MIDFNIMYDCSDVNKFYKKKRNKIKIKNNEFISFPNQSNIVSDLWFPIKINPFLVGAVQNKNSSKKNVENKKIKFLRFSTFLIYSSHPPRLSKIINWKVIQNYTETFGLG